MTIGKLWRFQLGLACAPLALKSLQLGDAELSQTTINRSQTRALFGLLQARISRGRKNFHKHYPMGYLLITQMIFELDRLWYVTADMDE